MSFLFQLSTILLLSAIITVQSDSDASEDLEHTLKGVQQCKAKDDGPGYCLSIIRCRRMKDKIRKFQNPDICFFQSGVPQICCPVTLRGSQNPGTTRSTQDTTNRQPITPRPITPTRTITNRPPPRPPQNDIRKSGFGLNAEGCGKNALAADGTGLVVGGKEARQHAWPWMVGIRTRTSGENTRFTCGGSLITKRHILTAAHCFGESGENREPSDFKVVLGSHFRDSGSAGVPVEDGVIVVTPIAIKVHADYKKDAQDNDVAIMVLGTDVPISEYVTPICLPTVANSRQETGNVTVIGWGDTNYGGTNSRTLQQASFKIVPVNKCRYMFRRVNLANGITDGMLCAGDTEGGKDSCQNDSGGPLLEHNSEENEWTQVGIVSFGYKCAEKGYPGVYTRVSTVFPWIQRIVRRTSS